MRRPTPIPQPTASNGTTAGPTARPSRPPAGSAEPTPRPPAEETVPLDAVRGGVASSEHRTPGRPSDHAPVPETTPRRPDAETLAGGPTPEAVAPAAPEKVGVREVWRAARARRRALRAEVRRFTQRQRRRRAVWLGAATAVLVLVAVTLAAAYSPLFAVEKITVVGTSQLSAADVESALSGQLGTPLASIDESAVKAALVRFPLVQSYALEARPPHDLVVRIVERTPIGVIKTAAGYTVVDAAGVALSTASRPPAGQPLLDIQGGSGSAAFASAGRVVRALPADIRSQLTGVKASTPDDVTLLLGATDTQIVWGSADDSAVKSVVLEKAMISRPPATVRSYDVSSAKAIVIR